MRRLLHTFLVVAALGLLPATAASQGLVRLGVGGGLTVPVSELADVTEQGYHGQVMLSINVPLFPLAGRLDAAYHHLPTPGDGHLRQFAITASGRVASIGLPLSPYLIAGVGLYNSRFTEGSAAEGFVFDSEARTAFGISGGAGLLLRLGILHAFIEGRYHHVFNDTPLQHVPITVGVLF